MVSMASMPNFNNQQEPPDQQSHGNNMPPHQLPLALPPPPPPLARSRMTPYDSLKELVKKKRKLHVQRHDNGTVVEPFSLQGHGSNINVTGAAAAQPPSKERKIAFGLAAPSSSQRHTLTHSVSAPVFKPSNFLRQALYPGSSGMSRNKSLSSFADANTGKRQRMMDGDYNALLNVNQLKRPAIPQESQLHRACCRGDGVAILQLLQQQPFHAGNSSQLKTLKKRYNPMFRIMETRRLKETYTYPINLALKYRASSDALRELVKLAPQVLTTPDGPNKETSLHILLQYTPLDVAIVDMILLKYPSIARWKDRHFNTPLHVACRHGCPLDVVRHLCIMYPDALFARNFHGLTPVDLANRNTSASSSSSSSGGYNPEEEEEVINYLWEAAAEQTEALMEQE